MTTLNVIGRPFPIVRNEQKLHIPHQETPGYSWITPVLFENLDFRREITKKKLQLYQKQKQALEHKVRFVNPTPKTPQPQRKTTTNIASDSDDTNQSQEPIYHKKTILSKQNNYCQARHPYINDPTQTLLYPELEKQY